MIDVGKGERTCVKVGKRKGSEAKGGAGKTGKESVNVGRREVGLKG